MFVSIDVFLCRHVFVYVYVLTLCLFVFVSVFASVYKQFTYAFVHCNMLICISIHSTYSTAREQLYIKM